MIDKSVLVTGGAGYIGIHTVRKLLENGYFVVVYDNLSTGHEEFTHSLNFVKGDISDQNLLSKTFSEFGVEAVIHFAANAYVGESVIDPRKYYSNNIQNGISLLNTMIDSDVKKIIFSSSCATYGVPESMPITEMTSQLPINPYGRTKLMFEQILSDYDDAYGLKHIALRYFNAAGADVSGDIGEWHEPETHIIPLLLKTAIGKRAFFEIFGTDFPTNDGTCIRDYIHVTDLADAHVKALEYLIQIQKSNQFNLGSGVGVSVKELVAIVREITGRKFKVVESNRRPGDPAVLIADSRKAQTILGWKPQNSSINNIVKTAWNWEKKK